MFEHELKNAYIGEVYEYSYDFRGKTSSNLTADGWTIVKGTPTLNTYWISGSDIRLTRGIDVSNAKKITISIYGTLSSANSFAWGIAKSVTTSWSVGWTWSFMSSESNGRQINIYWTSTEFSWISAWTYTQTATFDLENKTWKLSTTWKTDQTWTLTDTDVANIKNQIAVIYVYTAWSGSNWGLATYSITVE